MQTTSYPSDERLAGTQDFGRSARSALADGASLDVVRLDVGNRRPLRDAANDDGIVWPPMAIAMPSSFELHAAARATRSRQIRELIGSALRWLNGQFTNYLERRRQRAIARATYRTLRALDSRTLRDLGLERSEILSFALGTGRDHSSALRAARVANGLRLF